MKGNDVRIGNKSVTCCSKRRNCHQKENGRHLKQQQASKCQPMKTTALTLKNMQMKGVSTNTPNLSGPCAGSAMDMLCQMTWTITCPVLHQTGTYKRGYSVNPPGSLSFPLACRNWTELILPVDRDNYVQQTTPSRSRYEWLPSPSKGWDSEAELQRPAITNLVSSENAFGNLCDALCDAICARSTKPKDIMPHVRILTHAVGIKHRNLQDGAPGGGTLHYRHFMAAHLRHKNLKDDKRRLQDAWGVEEDCHYKALRLLHATAEIMGGITSMLGCGEMLLGRWHIFARKENVLAGDFIDFLDDLNALRLKIEARALGHCDSKSSESKAAAGAGQGEEVEWGSRQRLPKSPVKASQPHARPSQAPSPKMHVPREFNHSCFLTQDPYGDPDPSSSGTSQRPSTGPPSHPSRSRLASSHCILSLGSRVSQGHPPCAAFLALSRHSMYGQPPMPSKESVDDQIPSKGELDFFAKGRLFEYSEGLWSGSPTPQPSPRRCGHKHQDDQFVRC